MKIRNNQQENRYEAEVDGGVAFAEYHHEGSTVRFTHTEVPEESEGKGVAGRIVQFALDDCKTRGLKVVPVCGYVKAFISRHSEYGKLVAEE